MTNAAFVFELKSFVKENWNLDSVQNIFQLVVGVITTLVINAIVLLVVFRVIKKFEKIDEESKLNSVKDGLNKVSKRLFVIYYVNYFSIRYLILLFVGISDLLPSIALWSLLILAQVAFACLSSLKLMEDKVTRFINLLTEAYIALVFTYCLAC